MFQRLRQHVDIRDIHCYGGILLIAAGLAFVYWPAALVVPGAILLFLALRRAG